MPTMDPLDDLNIHRFILNFASDVVHDLDRCSDPDRRLDEVIKKAKQLNIILNKKLSENKKAEFESDPSFLWLLLRSNVMKALVHLAFQTDCPDVQTIAASAFDKIGQHLWDFLEDESMPSFCVCLLSSGNVPLVTAAVQAWCTLNFRFCWDSNHAYMQIPARDIKKKVSDRYRLVTLVESSPKLRDLKFGIGLTCRCYTYKLREKLVFNSAVLSSFKQLLLDGNFDFSLKSLVMTLFKSEDDEEIEAVIKAGLIPIFVSLLKNGNNGNQIEAREILLNYFECGTNRQVVSLIQTGVLDTLLDNLAQLPMQAAKANFNEINRVVSIEFSVRMIWERIIDMAVDWTSCDRAQIMEISALVQTALEKCWVISEQIMQDTQQRSCLMPATFADTDKSQLLTATNRTILPTSEIPYRRSTAKAYQDVDQHTRSTERRCVIDVLKSILDKITNTVRKKRNCTSPPRAGKCGTYIGSNFDEFDEKPVDRVPFISSKN